MGSFFTCSKGEEAQPNKESYSCIPRVENNYKDISYNALKNEINNRIKSIKRKNENNKFSYNNYEYEFSLLVKSIDDNEAHYDELEEGIPQLCRYSDIKTYKHNNLEINTETKYINASPIKINGKMIFISTQGPMSNTVEDFWVMVE